jgi:hypothetical protein
MGHFVIKCIKLLFMSMMVSPSHHSGRCSKNERPPTKMGTWQGLKEQRS